MAPDRYTANIEIKDLPRETNRILDTIVKLRGKYKWEVVREALIEYAERHKKDIITLVGQDRISS